MSRLNDLAMKALFITGIVLLLLSAYPIYLMLVEVIVSEAAYARYEVSRYTGENYDYRSAEFYGHRIALSDSLVMQSATDNEVKAPVSISIDGKDYSIPSPIEIHIYNGTKSYRGIALLNLKDRQTGSERLVVIQRVDGEQFPEDTRYRILFVYPDGAVTEEWFSYTERADPAYRTMLATFVHPEPLGFRSQVLHVWPSIFYPIIYPWLSCLVGLILSIIGARSILRR